MTVPRCLLLTAALALAAAPLRGQEGGDPLPPGTVRLGSTRLRHGERVSCLAFSPDGRRLATGSHDRTVRLWDAQTGLPIRTLRHTTTFVPALAFSPDGRFVAAETGDGVELVPVERGGPAVKVATQFADRLAFTPDGKGLWMLERGTPPRLRLRDTSSGGEQPALPPGPTTSFALSPDGILLATSGGEAVISLRAAATGAELRRLTGLDGPAETLVFSPDGKWLASAGGALDRAVRLWDVAAGKAVRRFPGAGHPAFAADGRTLALSGEGRVVLWDVVRDREQKTFPPGSAYTAAAFSPNAALLATAGTGHVVRLWDVAAARERFPQTGHVAGVTAVDFSPDSATVASSGPDGSIRLWDAATGREEGAIAEEGAAVALAFSADGRTLAAQGSDYRVRSYDVRSRRGVTGPGRPPLRDPKRAVSPDGRVVAVAGGARVRLWEQGTGRELLWIDGDGYTVHAVAFSPDGRFLATAGGLGDVRLWEVASGKSALRLVGHGGAARAVAFAPDGLRLASGADDTTVLVWRLAVPAESPSKGLESLWDDLAGDDAAAAYRGAWGLVAAGERAVEFLRPRVQSARDRQDRVRRLIADLDDDSYRKREDADLQLRAVGAAAEPDLRAARAASRSAEQKRRLDGLLAALQKDERRPTAGVVVGERLRTLRAVHALERIGSKAARAALEVLAAGPGEELETQAARAALARLMTRAATP